MAKRSARLKDIALATGFSANTVSLALRASDRIPRDTREVILAAARRLNYLPNQVAQSLVSRETKTIGLILTDIMNPTLTLAARSIEQELSARGYSLMLSATDNIHAKEIEALNVLRSRQVDGMLIYAANHRRLDHIAALRAAGYPIVLLVQDPGGGVDSVAVDDRAGAFGAAAHLARLGHRRIAMLDAARPLGNSEKAEGYEAALAGAGVALDPGLVVEPSGHAAAEGYEAFAELMRRGGRPTAVFASNDLLAVGVLGWCREHGLRVPDDLAVVGYDDIQAGLYVDPPLSTMHYAADTVSGLAVRRLLDLIDSPGDLPPPEAKLIVPELVVRASCGAAAKTRRRRSRRSA